MFVALHILEYSLIFVKGFSLIHIRAREGGVLMLLDRICTLCESQGISISKLEKEVGLGNATIRGWAKSSPKTENLKKVADFFGVTTDELLREE